MRVLWLLISLTVTATSAAEDNATEVSDGHLSMLEILTKYGYPGEEHAVTTSDGYILTVYRIPYGVKCGANSTRKSPILLQHGLLSNAIDWIISGIDSGLGYLLADDCFDVWMGNSRGNFESQKHVNLTKNDTEFWQFSWHEMGEHDLPAVIRYILTVTEQSALHYIGHSQGTTQSFIYASMYPEESADKIISMHSFAPVAFMDNMTSPVLRLAAQNLDSLSEILDTIGLGEFIPQLALTDELTSLCGDARPTLQEMCSNLLFLVCGFDAEQWNATLLPVIAGHDPAGASTRQIKHYGQEINSGKFRRYDHGEYENMILYGQLEPPDYEISKIKVPLYLWYGENDWLASVIDVERFAAQVPSAILKKVPFPGFNHLDFLWALDVKALLYEPLFEILNDYESRKSV